MANNTPETNEQQMSLQDVVEILVEKLKYDPQGQQLLGALVDTLNQLIQQNQSLGMVLQALVAKIQSTDPDFDLEAFVKELFESLQDEDSNESTDSAQA